MLSGQTIRPDLKVFIKKNAPDWTLDDYICSECFNRASSDLIEEHLTNEKGNLSSADKEVIRSIRRQEILSLRPSDSGESLTLGQAFADKLAEVGGSWLFIISFCTILLIWIVLNTYNVFFAPYDPYPFILLNLILSCLAALQAPVIMMSQNRKEIKDRHRAEDDYKTNLKAELEIRHLHLKLDQMISHQWAKLIKIEKAQLELLQKNESKPE